MHTLFLLLLRARARARGHSFASFILGHDKISRDTFIVAFPLPLLHRRFASRKHGTRWAISYYYLHRLSLLSSHCKRCRKDYQKTTKAILRWESGNKLRDLSLLEYRDDKFVIFNNLELTWKILTFTYENYYQSFCCLYFILSSKVNESQKLRM